MASLKQVGLLVLLVSVASGDQKCRTGCQGVTPNVFKYAEGTTYKYEYEGGVDLSLSSAEGQHSTTKVKATVLLTQQAQCNQILRIQNLQILSADSKKYSNIDDIEKPIKLNFHDGHIEDVICTEPSDSQNSLNIKRAVASLFQAALKHHGTEIDVFGSCPTTFSQHKEGQLQVIKKSRNLNKCSYRESLKQNFVKSAFDFTSEIKTSPFLQGEYDAELKLKNGIPQLITVTENYLYVPFSNGDKGAKANVVSVLKFVGTSKDNPRVSCTVPKTILFDDPHPITSEKSTVATLLKAVKDTANAIDVNVKDNSASKFNNVIKLLRAAPKKDIAAVYAQVRSGAGFTNKETAKRVFLDSLFRASTGAAVEVGIDVYKSHELNEIESRIFFVGLNFVKHVTEDALTAAANLVSTSSSLPREAYLGVGVLAGRFCRQHSCENVKALNTLLKALQAKITSRPANREAENLVVTVLKSVGNAEHVTNALAGKIIEAAQDKPAPARIRVAALEAYLSDPCNDRFRDSAVNILKDIQQDSEIRIKAYLASAECPNGKVANAVKKLLEDEPSIQVGGFIVSHLAALRASKNPDKAAAKAQLGQIRTTKKFPVDFRQYSFNGEYSYVFSSLGVAESVEANVIYSQKSFLPRSTSLNITTEIFGHRYNFLEIDTRQENLDSLLSSFAGPGGFLRQATSRNFLSKGSEYFKKIVDSAKERLKTRPKRDVNRNQIEAFSKQISDKENPLNKNLDLDLSIKLFGSELLFVSLNEELQQHTPESLIDQLLDGIDKTKVAARDFDKTLTSNQLFMDNTVSYPTSTGFPLRLSLEGVSSAQLKTSGKLDVDDLAQLKGNFKLSLIPSVNVELSARFVIDAAVVESGLVVVGNLYSSIGGAFEATLEEGKSVEYKFTLPLDKQEIISLTHDIIFETRELGGNEVQKPLKFIQSKDFSVCLDQLNPFIGLTFCASLNQPNVAEESTNVLPYPLNGDSKMAVYIENTDFGYYRFHYKENTGGGFKELHEIVDKQNKPKATFKCEVDPMSPSLILEFTSPVTSARFEARLVQSATEFYGLAKLTSDQVEYYAKLGVTYAGSDTRVVYKPIMEYKAGQGDAKQLPYHVTGQIILEQVPDGRRFTFDNIQLVSPDAKPISVTGNVAYQKYEVFSADLALSDGTHKGTIKGKLNLEQKGLSLNAQLVNDFNRALNFDIKYKLHVDNSQNINSDLQFIHGPDISNKNALFKLTNSISHSGEGDDSVFGTEHLLSYPGLNIVDKFKLKTSKKSLDLEVQFAYKNINLGTDLEVELDKKTKGDLDLELDVYGFENKLEVKLKRAVAGFKSKVNHKITLNGNSIEVSGDVRHLIEQHRGDIGHDLVIKITSRPDIKFKTELKYSQNDIDALIKVVSGQDVYIDAFIKANKGGDANGNLKISVPGRLIANGQIKALKGVGNTNLLLNFVEIQRKVKTEAAFTIKDPTYNLDVTLYSNFEKDNSKKYQFTTQNTIKEESLLDTKNTLDILGDKTVVNLKLAQNGDINNFEQIYEYEVILPNLQYFAGKFNRKVKNDKGVINAEAQLNMEQRPSKNAAGRTLSFKGIGKNINTNEGLLDLTYNLALDDGAGKTLNGELELKKAKQNEDSKFDYRSKLYGSVIPEPLETTVTVVYNDNKVDYKLSSSYGSIATLNIKSKYDHHGPETGKPCNADLYIEYQQPNSRIKVAKLGFQGSLLQPKTDDGTFDIKTTSFLYIQNDDAQAGGTLDIKSENELKLSSTKGYYKESINAQKLDPITLTLGYEYEPNKKYSGDIAVEYAKKSVKGTAEIDIPSENTAVVKLYVETPDERAKQISLVSKITDTDTSFSSESTFKINDLVYVGQVALDLNDKQPYYNIELKYPNGKVDKFYGKQLKSTDESIAGESKIILHVYDFTLDYNYDITVQSMEDFNIKIYVDSPKFNLNKITLTANTKDVHGAKKLVVNAKQGEKNIVNGVTTYKIKKEDGKVTIDGQGTLTVNNEKKTGSFKVLYRELNEKRDKEEGLQVQINSNIGTKAFDIEYILTTDQFKYLTTYCVEKKECANIEFNAEDKDDVDILVINVDLRPLGVSHEFGLKAETQVKQLKHSLDMHMVSNQFKYQYNSLVLPTESHFTLTTPKRVISLESQVNSPKKNEPYKGTIALYLNKKAKPNEKTALDFEVATAQEQEGSFTVKLTTPALKKPLYVKCKLLEKSEDNGKYQEEDFELVLDVLSTGNKKFFISTQAKADFRNDRAAKVTSVEVVDLQPLNYKLTENALVEVNYQDYLFNLEYELKSVYENKPAVFSYKSRVDPTVAYSRLVLNNKQIFDVTHKTKYSKEYSTIDSTYNVVGIEPRTSKLEVKGGNTLKFAFHKTGDASKKLQVNAGLIPGSIADFRMDLLEGSKKVDLFHGSIKLDEEDFGKSDYGINSNNVKEYLITPSKSLYQHIAKESTDAVTQATSDFNKNLKDLTEIAKTKTPDYSPVVTYYKSELDTLREEVITDPSLKELGEKLSDIAAAGIKIATDLLKAIGDIVGRTVQSIQIQMQKVLETIQKDLLPRVQQLVNNISEKFLAIFESASNLVFSLFDQVSAFLDAHQKELKQIVTTLSQVNKEIIRFIQKVTEHVTDVFTSEVSKITEELKALPIAEDLENYVKQISAGKEIPEESIQQFKQHVDELKSKAKHDKVAKFIQLTGAYLEKKMRNQKCDDIAEVAAIISAGIDALDQLINEFVEVDYDSKEFLDLPIPSKILDSLPEIIFGQDSLVTRIVNGDIPELSQLSSFLTLNPRQFILPFRKYAVVAQGQHIFTFDGRHLTFPGKCSYLLSRDIVRDEFSIVGTYVNGALSELTFADKHDVITLKKTGAASLNGANAEFPIRRKLTHAYRTYDEVQLKSDNGVRIYCQPDLSLCLFSVSGFYHGHIRGILGNANAEPYDDYTIPKGNIVTSESEFGNAYKLQANCPAVKTVDHHTHQHADACTKLFTELSELSVCFPFVNTHNFRQACDHGVAANIPNTVEAIAAAYSTACASRYIPAFLPSEYVKCKNSEKPYDLYETFSVKLPQKAADIVFAVDADESNAEIYKDLITPLGNALTKELADRGIKDVDYHVLTYGGDFPDYPSHITTNSGKLTFKGKMPAVKFSETAEDDDIDVGFEPVNFILSVIKSYVDELNLALGNDPQGRAFVEAIQYPFRPQAAKTIIAVSSRSCPKGLFQGLQRLRALLLRQSLVSLNLFTPYSDDCEFKVKDDKTTKNVIGFNKEGVFTFSDAKKKPAGNPDLLKDLSYNDFCSEEVVLGGGNVFVLDNFNKNKQLYTKTAAFNIADGLASTEQGLDCICMRNGLLTGENFCRTIYSRKKATAQKKLLKG